MGVSTVRSSLAILRPLSPSNAFCRRNYAEDGWTACSLQFIRSPFSGGIKHASWASESIRFSDVLLYSLGRLDWQAGQENPGIHASGGTLRKSAALGAHPFHRSSLRFLLCAVRSLVHPSDKTVGAVSRLGAFCYAL